jgi:hypothetical protein
MTEVVFPANATRTSAYTKKMFDDFAERTNILANDFPPGALVMRRVNPRESKMSPVWDGPFFIIRRTRGGPYLLRDSLNNQLIEKVPAARLKLISYEGAPSPDTFEVEAILDHKGLSRRSFVFDPVEGLLYRARLVGPLLGHIHKELY